MEEQYKQYTYHIEALHRYPGSPPSVTVEILSNVKITKEEAEYRFDQFVKNQESDAYTTYTLIPHRKISKEEILAGFNIP